MFIKEKVLDNIRIKSLMFQREEFEIYKILTKIAGQVWTP